MLAHRTPPSCISSNIISVAKIILPKSYVIHQLLHVEFIHSCRGNLLYLTNILDSDELARAPKFLDQHSDGIARRRKEFQNNIVRIAKEGGFKHVTLDSCIMSVDGIR